MNKPQTELPHWDMHTVFPSLDSAEFAQAFKEGIADIEALTAFFDEHGIMLRETPPEIDADVIAVFEQMLTRFNALGTQLHLLQVYLLSFVVVDSRHAAAQARLSALQQVLVQVSMLQTRMTAWVGGLDIDALITASDVAAAHAFALRKSVVQAHHLMTPAEEALATRLQLTGGVAWVKLYNDFSSQININLEVTGESKMLPMTAVRNLAFDSHRETRKAAYEAELAAWEAHAVPIAAALNSVKGELLTLSAHRGWDSPLDLALFNNHIDRATLDAMLGAAREFFPELRRYLRSKAQALKLPVLAWYDLFAPVTSGEQPWAFPEARAFILEKFGGYSHELQQLARRAFDEQWIDAEPRSGKRGGAFCAWLQGGESRILANYQPSYGGMATLAHELGHAYHNLMRQNCTYIQRQTPMTLAETASTFCETIVREAALAQATPLEQLSILEASLQDTLQIILDITSRFQFESAVFEQRKARELSPDEVCALMVEAQRDTYGDGLDATALHPYMWAVKPHYYGSTFYNFPYMFGQLFSLGLYARYQEAPSAFRESYDTLLSLTGMYDAATLGRRFGIDVHAPAFWRASLDLIRMDIDRFDALVNELQEQT
ncbi:MAG: M3 family oligoendopeptidase [Anaerolineae bacterium]|nr:M3 family oligoendopeptidase [Anaerolineae bacterium]